MAKKATKKAAPKKAAKKAAPKRSAASIKADKARVAKKPGVRKAASGKTYTEVRENRSDKNKKKRL